MKINALPSEEDGFKFYPVNFCGIESYLIIPEIMAKWNKFNLHFRSLIVRQNDLEVLSSGWPKFCNYGEKPDAYPDPLSYKDWTITEKMDGSLVICDSIDGVFNMRTRGTPSYISQANAPDFDLLPVMYPKVVEYLRDHPNISLLWEIVTPNNVIVVWSETVTFTLLGAVDKDTLKPLPQAKVDEIAKFIDAPQPKVYTFKNIEELKESVEKWEGKEGVVLAYNKNLNRVKFKGAWYLLRHRLKSELSSESNFIDLYVAEGMPTYDEFYKILEGVTDFETAVQFRGRISKAVDAGKEVKRILEHMDEFVKEIRNFPSRKEQALAITQAYGQTNRAGFVFSRLDNRALTNDNINKLMWQVLKN